MPAESFLGGSDATGPSRATSRTNFYPSPFFDIAGTYLPQNPKSLFQFCRYYYYTVGVIGAAVDIHAGYPITDIVIDEDDPKLNSRWNEITHEKFHLKSFMLEMGKDYFCTGNSLVSFYMPFKRFLVCRVCKTVTPMDTMNYEFKNWTFEARCANEKCGVLGKQDIKDEPIKDLDQANLVRWAAENIDIDFNPITGRRIYKYNIPNDIRMQIIQGRRYLLESIPFEFLDAVKAKLPIIFNPKNIFHLRRGSLAEKNQGWGEPAMIRVLKDTFYLQILKKAREAIAFQHIVPLWVIFPEAHGELNPYEHLNLGEWRGRVEDELRKWRQDCVVPETLVETSEGLRRADKVKEGDLLRNDVGGLSLVEKVWRRPLRKSERALRFSIRGMTVQKQVVSEGHPFLAARQQNKGNGHKLGEAAFIRARDLQVGDYIAYPINRTVVQRERIDLGQFTTRAVTKEWVYTDHTKQAAPEIFEMMERGEYEVGPKSRQDLLEKHGWNLNDFKCAQQAVRQGRKMWRVERYLPFDKELAWVVGLYLAEGNCSNKQVMFSLHDKEKPYMDRLETFFRKHFDATGFVHRVSEHGVQLIFSSRIAADLFRLMCPGVSRTKRIPEIYRNAEEEIILSLLKGLFDGDGCWHNDGYSRKSTLSTASLQMAQDTRQILFSLRVPSSLVPIPAHAYEICGKTGWSEEAYSLCIYGDSSDRLLAYFNGTEDLGIRRCDIGVFKGDYFWSRINGIEEWDAEEVIGFQMDKSEEPRRIEDDTESHGTFCTLGMVQLNSNYIPIFPAPMGFQFIGGTFKSLDTTPEMQNLLLNIMAGMNMQQEFIYGGGQYTGTSFSVRMLSNLMSSYRSQLLEFVNGFFIKRIAEVFDIKSVKMHFTELKFADDVQRKTLFLQLNAQNKLSTGTLLSEMGLDASVELKKIKDELKLQGEIMANQMVEQEKAKAKAMIENIKGQIQAQLKQQSIAAEAQMEMEEQNVTIDPEQPFKINPDLFSSIFKAGPNESPYHDEAGRPMFVIDPVSVPATVLSLAKSLMAANEKRRNEILKDMQMSMPGLHDMVSQQMQTIGPAGNSQPVPPLPVPSTDMRPLPTQKPPRRNKGQA